MKKILIIIASFTSIVYADIATNSTSNTQHINDNQGQIDQETPKPQNANDFLDIGDINLPKVEQQNSVEVPKVDIDSLEATKNSQEAQQTEPKEQPEGTKTKKAGEITLPPSGVVPKTTSNMPLGKTPAEVPALPEPGAPKPSLDTIPKVAPTVAAPEANIAPTKPAEPVPVEQNTMQTDAVKVPVELSPHPKTDTIPTEQNIAPSVPTPYTEPTQPKPVTTQVPKETNKVQQGETQVSPLLQTNNPPAQPEHTAVPTNKNQSVPTKAPVAIPEQKIPKATPKPQNSATKAVISENTEETKSEVLTNKKVVHTKTYPDPEFFSAELNELVASDDDVVNGKLTQKSYLENLNYEGYIKSFWEQFISTQEVKKALKIENYLKNYERFNATKNTFIDPTQ
jgi:hypothetical protein